MPVIRYRTRDICTLRREKCDCGRTLITMDKILGRSDDMMIISGVNVFPSQVEVVLMEFEEVEPQYQIRLRKKGYIDNILVETEVKPATYQAARRNWTNSPRKYLQGYSKSSDQCPVNILPQTRLREV